MVVMLSVPKGEKYVRLPRISDCFLVKSVMNDVRTVA